MMQNDFANKRFPNRVKRPRVRQILLERLELEMQCLRSMSHCPSPTHSRSGWNRNNWRPTFNRLSSASVVSFFPDWTSFSGKSSLASVARILAKLLHGGQQELRYGPKEQAI